MYTYDDNCEFEWINIWDNLDHYYLAHCINWLLASLILRDAWILNIWQLLDEVIELSWQHILPHFRECWWDHIILDIMLSNIIAIFLGIFIIRKLGMDQYDWLGRNGKSFFKWDIWNNYLHYKNTMSIIIIISVNFLDGFFINNQLWV